MIHMLASNVFVWPFYIRFLNPNIEIRTPGFQVFPGNTAKFVEVYNEATKYPFGYLLLDLHQLINPKLRMRTNIFSGEVVKVSQV